MARIREEQKTKKIYTTVCLIAVVVIVGFVALYFLLTNLSKTKVDLNEKTHLSLYGFNGDAEIVASLDNDDAYGAFLETVVVNFSKSSGLANGDEVFISYDFDKQVAKQYNLKVSFEDTQYTISGLIDAVELSPEKIFEGVNVRFEGIAPLVEASIELENGDFEGAISYEILGDKNFFDIGDKVTVRAVYNDEDLAAKNYVANIPSSECIKEFVVEGMDRYVTKVDEISEDMIASLRRDALSLFTDANEYGMRIFCDAGLMPVYINKKTTFVWNSPNYVSSYINVLKEEKYGSTGKHVNDIKMCFESMISQADGKACRAEVIVMYENIIIRADGTVDLNLESGDIVSADRRDSHIKALVNNQLDDDYESEKIEF